MSSTIKEMLTTVKTIKLGTWIRTALMVLALINSMLQMMGKNILPLSDKELAAAITYIFTALTFLINWWKNNSFTKAAQSADKVLFGEAKILIDEFAGITPKETKSAPKNETVKQPIQETDEELLEGLSAVEALEKELVLSGTYSRKNK